MARCQYEPFAYNTPPELAGTGATGAPVIIVGAGPIGLATHGVASIAVDDNNVVSVGSRAICWAKRSLEIFDRLGIGERMLAKGVTWKLGRVYRGDAEVYHFDLLPEDGHRFPAFINLQQYYVEQYLVERCADFPDLVDLRFKNKVLAVGQDASGAYAEIESRTEATASLVNIFWPATARTAASAASSASISRASISRNAFLSPMSRWRPISLGTLVLVHADIPPRAVGPSSQAA